MDQKIVDTVSKVDIHEFQLEVHNSNFVEVNRIFGEINNELDTHDKNFAATVVFLCMWLDIDNWRLQKSQRTGQ